MSFQTKFKAWSLAALLVPHFIVCGCGSHDDAMTAPKDQEPKVSVGHTDGPTTLPPGVVLVQDRPEDAPDRVDRSPKVSDDAALISESCKLFDKNVELLFKSALEQIRKGDFVDSEHKWVLGLRKRLAISDLKKLLAKQESTATRGRARAAAMLVGFGDAEGERFLFASLNSPSVELRKAALEMLGDWDVKLDFGASDRGRLVLTLIEDPNPGVSAAAYRLAVRKNIAGTAAKLVALLESGRAKDPRDVARELADVADTPQAVRVMLDALLKERPAKHEQRTGFRLERLIQSSNVEISEPVKTAFREFTLGYTGKDRYDQSVVNDLAMVADATTIPVLEDIVAHAKDSVSRVYAKEALARLDPSRAVDRLLDFIRPGQPYEMEVEALGKFATEQDADRIISVLLNNPKQVGQPAVSFAVTRLLFERLGTKGRAAVQQSMNRLEQKARMLATWRLNGLDLGTAIDELHVAGVLPLGREPLLKLMREARERDERGGQIDMADPDTLTEAISWAGIFTAFDAETGQLPCDHHRLILKFAENSNGRFKPECPVQTWHRKSNDDFDAPYTVRFVYQNRLYTFGAENRGDWYDVTAVTRALNFALKTAGQPERFIALNNGDQIASFIFADPQKFLPIASKYALVLSDDPDEAMRKGKEFEQRVLNESGN